MAIILDGRKIRDRMLSVFAEKIAAFDVKPGLAIIQVGSREESNAYINQKKKFGEKIGVVVKHTTLDIHTSEEDILKTIISFNKDSTVHGIILQLPLPAELNKEKLIEAIDPKKDVDGLHSANIKNLLSNERGLVPATARGVLRLLEEYTIEIKGKKVLVIGASMLVGRPIALHLLNKGATVTIAHSKSVDVPSFSQNADIIIVATGSPKLITEKYVRKGQTIIDVGITSIEDTSIAKKILVGDVDFNAVSNIVDAITPVPGGVGPMTIACLFENLLQVYEMQEQK